jgi:hypothetical protein
VSIMVTNPIFGCLHFMFSKLPRAKGKMDIFKCPKKCPKIGGQNLSSILAFGRFERNIFDRFVFEIWFGDCPESKLYKLLIFERNIFGWKGRIPKESGSMNEEIYEIHMIPTIPLPPSLPYLTHTHTRRHIVTKPCTQTRKIQSKPLFYKSSTPRKPNRKASPFFAYFLECKIQGSIFGGSDLEIKPLEYINRNIFNS